MTRDHDPRRRRLLQAGALTGAGIGIGAGAAALLGGPLAPGADPGAATASADEGARLLGPQTVPFFGEHQSGVTTAPPAHATFLGLDLRQETDRAGILRMLRVLTDDARRLMAGEAPLADTEPELAENPAHLTVTVGFGPRLLERAQREVPDWLAPLPPFEIDDLQPELGDGDLMVQVAGDDPLAVAHGVRMLLKSSRGTMSLRWQQQGFRRAHGTVPEGTTMRNLFGQVDGTANAPLDSKTLDQVVWIEDGPWTGGTSMVIRRIRMNLDTWDELDRTGREKAIGRRLSDGAPLGGTSEHDGANWAAVSENGFPVIPEFSHFRRAAGIDGNDGGQRIFRRGYNYDQPPGPGVDGISESGQIFVSFQADVLRQFLPIQLRLAELDLLNTWTTPIGSAVFAIPPGTAEGAYIGEGILA